jgi:hypothetical protein
VTILDFGSGDLNTKGIGGFFGIDINFSDFI